MSRYLEEVKKVWDRKTWTQERDKKEYGPVPKGVAKFSMGDALDTFHKAAAKGPQQGVKATEELLKKVREYKTAVKVKYPKFHDRIGQTLEKAAGTFMTNAQEAFNSIVPYQPRYNDLLRQLNAALQSWKPSGLMSVTGEPRGHFTNVAPLLTALTAFKQVCDLAKRVSPSIRDEHVNMLNMYVGVKSDEEWSQSGLQTLATLILQSFPKAIS